MDSPSTVRNQKPSCIRLFMSGQTLFERIVSGEVPSHKVAEGEHWYAFLDIFPRSDGHTLVIPKRGVSHISMLDVTETHSLFDGMRKAQSILSAHFQTTDFTICIHDGKLAGQEVPHVHIHVIPRTEMDGGLTLMAMWPDAEPIGTDAKHELLGILAEQLREV